MRNGICLLMIALLCVVFTQVGVAQDHGKLFKIVGFGPTKEAAKADAMEHLKKIEEKIQKKLEVVKETYKECEQEHKVVCILYAKVADGTREEVKPYVFRIFGIGETKEAAKANALEHLKKIEEKIQKKLEVVKETYKECEHLKKWVCILYAKIAQETREEVKPFIFPVMGVGETKEEAKEQALLHVKKIEEKIHKTLVVVKETYKECEHLKKWICILYVKVAEEGREEVKPYVFPVIGVGATKEEAKEQALKRVAIIEKKIQKKLVVVKEFFKEWHEKIVCTLLVKVAEELRDELPFPAFRIFGKGKTQEEAKENALENKAKFEEKTGKKLEILKIDYKEAPEKGWLCILTVRPIKP